MKQLGKLLIGKKYKNLIELDNVIYIPDNPYIDTRLSGHVDLSVFSDEKGTVFSSQHLNMFDFIHIDEKQSSNYPEDVQLNISLCGNNAFLNEKYVSRKIFNYLKQGEWNIIPVNQGYAKCSALTISDNSLITSDIGIYEAAIKNNIDALLISPGYVDLEGFDYGFIGGAGFLYNNKLYFTGQIDNHPDKNKIINFTNKYNLDIVFITDKNIFDIGGAILI